MVQDVTNENVLCMVNKEMLMKIKNYLLIILTILVQGCASEQDIKFDSIWVYNADAVQPKAPDFVESVSYLSLESNKESMFKGIDKILFENQFIYIADYRLKKIIAYNQDGTVRFVLDRFGRGPGEYLDIKSFAVNGSELYILDNFNRKIFIYDSLTGNFKNSVNINFIAWDMAAFENGDFIFAFSPMKGGELNQQQIAGRVFITDNNFNVKKSFFDYEPGDYDIIGQLRYFSTYGEMLVYSSIYFDGYAVFDRYNSDIREIVRIEFDNPIPSRFGKDDSILDDGYDYMSSVPIMCKDYSIIEVSSGEYVDNLLYDSKSREFAKNPDFGRKYLYCPISSIGDFFVSYIDMAVYDELVAIGFDKAEDDVEAHLSAGNPVLLFYKMK